MAALIAPKGGLLAFERSWPGAPEIPVRIRRLPPLQREISIWWWEQAQCRLVSSRWLSAARAIRPNAQGGLILMESRLAMTFEKRLAKLEGGRDILSDQLQAHLLAIWREVATDAERRAVAHRFCRAVRAAGIGYRYRLPAAASRDDYIGAGKLIAKQASNALRAGDREAWDQWLQDHRSLLPLRGMEFEWENLFQPARVRVMRRTGRPSPEVRKAINHKWLARRLRKLHPRAIEDTWREAAPTQIRYISDDAVERAKREYEEQKAFAEAIYFKCSNGTVIDGAKLMDADKKAYVGWAKTAKATNAVFKLAIEAGWTIPVQFTITAPSRKHSTTTWDWDNYCRIPNGGRQANPRYDGSSPRDVHDLFQAGFTKFNQWANKHDHMPAFAIGVEVHEDGTPHWHLTTLVKSVREAAVLRQKLRKIYRSPGVTNRELRRQIKGSIITDKLGRICEPDRAIAYAMKCASYGYKHLFADGSNDHEEAARNGEAARIWGWRRYRTGLCHKTLWDALKREDLQVDGTASAVKAAREANDYKKYLKERKSAGLRPLYMIAETENGDVSTRLIGCQIRETDEMPEQEWFFTNSWQMHWKDSDRLIAGKVRHRNQEIRVEPSYKKEIARRRVCVEAGEVVGGAPPPLFDAYIGQS